MLWLCDNGCLFCNHAFRYMRKNIRSYIKYRELKKQQLNTISHGRSQHSEENNENAHVNTGYVPARDAPRNINQIHLHSDWKDNRKAAYMATRPNLMPRKALNIENNLNKSLRNPFDYRYRRGLEGITQSNVELSATRL